MPSVPTARLRMMITVPAILYFTLIEERICSAFCFTYPTPVRIWTPRERWRSASARWLLRLSRCICRLFRAGVRQYCLPGFRSLMVLSLSLILLSSLECLQYLIDLADFLCPQSKIIAREISTTSETLPAPARTFPWNNSAILVVIPLLCLRIYGLLRLCRAQDVPIVAARARRPKSINVRKDGRVIIWCFL